MFILKFYLRHDVGMTKEINHKIEGVYTKKYEANSLRMSKNH